MPRQEKRNALQERRCIIKTQTKPNRNRPSETSDNATRHEAVVDRAIVEAQFKLDCANRPLSWAFQHLIDLTAGVTGKRLDVNDIPATPGERRRRRYDEVVAAAEKLAGSVDDGHLPPHCRRNYRVTEALAEYREFKAAVTAAVAEVRLAESKYEGWSRFFKVTSSKDGHIHSSLSCSTCTCRTRFAWLPDLSGLDETDAVVAEGAILCTVCFPSAPVEYTNYYELEEARKLADSCPGSGLPGVEGKSRQGWGGGNYHTCPKCGGRIGGKGYNVRKHKAKTTK